MSHIINPALKPAHKLLCKQIADQELQRLWSVFSITDSSMIYSLCITLYKYSCPL